MAILGAIIFGIVSVIAWVYGVIKLVTYTIAFFAIYEFYSIFGEYFKLNTNYLVYISCLYLLIRLFMLLDIGVPFVAISIAVFIIAYFTESVFVIFVLSGFIYIFSSATTTEFLKLIGGVNERNSIKVCLFNSIAPAFTISFSFGLLVRFIVQGNKINYVDSHNLAWFTIVLSIFMYLLISTLMIFKNKR